jgi:hypothetical protein
MPKSKALVAIAAFWLAALRLGGPATANPAFDFRGDCAAGCTGVAIGVLTLTDAYSPGDDITTADFVSLQYLSSQFGFEITSADNPIIVGGLNADGSFNAAEELIITASGGLPNFEAVPGMFQASATGDTGDLGPTFKFTEASPAPGVPEPSTWIMMILGVAGLSFAGYRNVSRAALSR